MNMHFWRATLRSIKYRGAASTTDAAPNTPAPGTGNHAKARQALVGKQNKKVLHVARARPPFRSQLAAVWPSRETVNFPRLLTLQRSLKSLGSPACARPRGG